MGRRQLEAKAITPKELALALALSFIAAPVETEAVAREYGLWPALQASLAHELHLAHARTDPNVFIEYCIVTPKGETTVQAHFHRTWQHMLTVGDNVLIAAPRGHGKSASVTNRLVWELGNNHNLRIKVLSSKDDFAEDIIGQVQDTIAKNRRVHEVFPTLKLDYDAGVTKSKFNVERTISDRNASVTASGVMSSGAGGRADILVCDDVVDYANSVKNPADRAKVLQVLREVWFSLVSDTGVTWYLCTPYHQDDATHHLRSTGEWDVWWEPAISYEIQYDENNAPVKDENGTTVTIKKILWPEWWTEAKLEKQRKKIGEITFTRQYLLKVMSDDELTFPLGALLPSYDLTLNDIGFCAPGVPIPNDWPTFGGIDLASSMNIRGAFTTIWTLARCPENDRLYLKELVRKKLKFHEVIREIKRAFERHLWHYALVENNAFQKAVETELGDKYAHIPIEGAHTGSNKRDLDVGLPGLASAFSRALFVLPAMNLPLHEEDTSLYGIFWQELAKHPGAAHSDTIMALWLAYRAYLKASGKFHETYAECMVVA